MLVTTDAIILSLQPYSDKAHILHTYTRTGGRVNYMVYGLGRKNTAGKYSPLSIVQLTTDERSIRTAQLTFVPATIVADPYKQAIALFISEVLYHVLRHPMPDEPLFDFIAKRIETLDKTDHCENFHLDFMTGLSEKLGFGIPEVENVHTRAERQKALRNLCDYFEQHVETWENPKSLDILMEVFD